MKSNAHHTSTYTPLIDESTEKLKEAMVQPLFKVENITVARPPLLKIYYWESFAIENLNNKLSSQDHCIEHHLELPASQLNSNPLKIIFWLRSLANVEYSMSLKRIKNCQCTQKETRVGFNQYRNLYHCPHRHLINICENTFEMSPDKLLAMTLVSYYYILGKYTLSYELKISNGRIIILHFHVNITTFDPVTSVLTTSMIPVNIKEHRFMSQPLWIQNTTKQSIPFSFRRKNCDIRIINPNIVVPPQSVWPLIVGYRPRDFENHLDIFLRYGDKAKSKCNAENCYKIPITCKAFTEEEIENYTLPNFDHECGDFRYIIYPNRLEFITEVKEEKTLMVAVHNYDEKCMEFKWQRYTLNEYFSFTFEPAHFSLKPHHSKLCIVQVKTFNKPLHFKRIPAVLEIHYIQDNSTKIAQQLLTEIDSIDDPKWAQSTYMEHILLHLDIKVRFPSLQRINMEKEDVKSFGSIDNGNTTKISNNCITIFEKLFWEYLSKSYHMRNTAKVPRNLTYKEVLSQQKRTTKNKGPYISMPKQDAFNILSFLTAEACRDLAKNYCFIPPETLNST